MNDEQLIETIAQIWVSNGGDAEGIDWSLVKIKEKINELIEKKRVKINEN